MSLRIWVTLLLAAQLSFTFVNPVRAGLPDGVAAFGRGDYATALREILPLAKQGNPVAQLVLGQMYSHGLGVPRNYTEAVTWIRRSAEQGNAYGQNSLAMLYAVGQGVPQDYVQAYMWLTLAVSRSSGAVRENMLKSRDTVASQMTPAQIAQAQRLAKAWKPPNE